MATDIEEKEILKFWHEKKIYQKSKKQNQNGGKFYMMDGPPYATGNIHMGTALNKISKDIAMRAQRLQGKDVFDRTGYDIHGVPIEFKVEKEINSKSKQDIEKFGVKNFIEKCKEYATKYIGIMGEEFKNLGVWMDFENPYLTLDPSYIETIWDTFKVADEKKLLYLGLYPVHICPRCETAVSFNEIEYAKQKDTSVFVKFALKKKKDTYLIIWTTTPWTLPANTGVMVHPNENYSVVELSSGEKWVVASKLLPKIMAELELGFTLKEEIKGEEMVGWEYISPLAKHIKLKPKNSYRVVPSARYVTTEDGTGLVHCAPGHGKEDYEVGKENNLDAPSPVDINGNLTAETGKYAGKKARVVDAEIIEDLEKENALVYKMEYTHDYPLCWRCKSPLLMISQSQWFLKISEIKEKILQQNNETNWTPKWMQLRMNAWLEGISDWPISRKRYWGTPLPIWICKKCNNKIVVGSIAELEKLSGAKINEVHKPEIDEIKIKCQCGSIMNRVDEVLDVWFDSGVSSWAALNYMQDKKQFQKFWPADLNLEGKDQIRGWWNSQFILSEIKFGKKPFENILVHGMVLDIGKVKMSKSLGNIISPEDVIRKYGRDFLRYYFAKLSKGEDFSFQEREFSDITKIFITLSNVAKFISQIKATKKKEEIEDKWIISRLNSTIKEVVSCYNEFRFPDAIANLEQFLVEDLSRTYIQIIRERSGETKKLLEEILVEILKLYAPIIPFASEKFWQELKTSKIVKEESIHLSSIKNNFEIDEGLENNFILVKQIIEKGLAQRDAEKISLRWPLSEIKIFVKSGFGIDKFSEIIKSQLNVKEIKIMPAKETELTVEINTKITPELEAEGFARELSRKIQSARKNASLKKEDRIIIAISSEFNDKLKNQLENLKEKIGAEEISLIKNKQKYDYSEEGKIKDKNFFFSFSKKNIVDKS